MPYPKVALAAALAGTALAVPAAASAQIDPGVNYDPGSPAGKEYAIPFVEGRSDGAGTTNQREGANIPFGVGITPPGGNGGGEQGSGGNGGGEPGSGGDTGSGATGGENPGAHRGESAEELRSRIARAEEPSGTAARTFLLALAVLLPAALLALLLIQRSQVSRTGRTA
jgi:hypothetical protein